MTHDELIARAARWLRNSRRCVVVLTEAAQGVFWTREEPDAIGWLASGKSILVECKASIGDFYSDKSKISRRQGSTMGFERWYLTDRGLIEPSRNGIPDGWGLLEVHGRRIKVIVECPHYYIQPKKSPALSEVALLVATVRWKIEDRMGP